LPLYFLLCQVIKKVEKYKEWVYNKRKQKINIERDEINEGKKWVSIGRWRTSGDIYGRSAGFLFGKKY